MRRSDWCEQHTTLHANIDFFSWKKETKKLLLFYVLQFLILENKEIDLFSRPI